MDNVAAVLQYGALGLLAVVIAGFFWYVRSVEARAAKREEAERERQKQLDERAERREHAAEERQEKYLSTLIKNTSTLALLASRIEAHDARMQEEHKAIMSECFSRRGIGE